MHKSSNSITFWYIHSQWIIRPPLLSCRQRSDIWCSRASGDPSSSSDSRSFPDPVLLFPFSVLPAYQCTVLSNKAPNYWNWIVKWLHLRILSISIPYRLAYIWGHWNCLKHMGKMPEDKEQLIMAKISGPTMWSTAFKNQAEGSQKDRRRILKVQQCVPR